MDKHHAGQFGVVYKELCEVTHFGAVAMWMPHRIEAGDESRLSWTSYPRWKQDTEALVACAQTLEMSAAMDDALRRLGQLVVG
jgi:hypothetical protein